MITEEEALARILASVHPLPSRAVSIVDALNCFTARDIFAAVASPPFDNSSMDGYAVVAAACRSGARLKVVGEQPAGVDRRLHVACGEALRIFTGAPMPVGADAVIMQEETRVEGDEVVLLADVAPGENVRRRGGDIAEGQKLIARGERVRAQNAALLASQGFSSIEIGGRVRAAIISTGDELVAPGRSLEAGQIYDSNSVLLEALLRNCGADIFSMTHCGDQPDETEAALAAGSAAEVMIITGGVSVGARDFVKSALVAAGATLDLWRVAVKPGKPFLFGRTETCAIFGLPGNPVSAFVTFLLFVRPAIFKLMGANESALGLTQVSARLTESIRNPGERPHYVRGVLLDGRFEPVGRQESHALFGLSRANALIRVAPEANLARDANVTALLLD